MIKNTIFGTGDTGLVTGSCLAEVGHGVSCVDIDAARHESLNLVERMKPLRAPSNRNHGPMRLEAAALGRCGIGRDPIIAPEDMETA